MQTEPAVRRARELVGAGVLGDPVHAHGTNSQRVLEMIPDPDQWRLDWELSGGCATMVADRRMTAGAHRVRWRAEGVPSGTYFARLETNGTVRTQAVTVVR